MSQIAREVAEKVQASLTRLRVLYERIADDYDLTPAQMTIMELLLNNGPTRISVVAETEGIRMPTASNALVHLERRDLVKRVRDDVDRRGVKVALTELGEKEYKRVAEQRQATLTKLISHLDDETLEKSGELADLIVDLAERYYPSKTSREDS